MQCFADLSVSGFSPSAKDPFQQQMSSAAYTLTSAQEGSPWQPQPVAMRKLPLTHIISLLIHDSNTGSCSIGAWDRFLLTAYIFNQKEVFLVVKDTYSMDCIFVFYKYKFIFNFIDFTLSAYYQILNNEYTSTDI